MQEFRVIEFFMLNEINIREKIRASGSNFIIDSMGDHVIEFNL